MINQRNARAIVMRCPRCGFEGEPVNGRCARCGYGQSRVSSGGLRNGSRAVNQSPVLAQMSGSYAPNQPNVLMVRTLKRGDVLRRGRYRLLEQLMLPANQQDQGTA